MVGVLTALPGTQLWRRLEREGRLRGTTAGDQFDRTNFETTMPEEELMVGYRTLLANLFDADAFFQRCELSLRTTPVRPSPFHPGGLRILARALWHIGLRGERRRRRWFWRMLLITAPRGIDAVTRAVTFSIVGEHFVRYTAEEVLPRLDQRIEEIRREAAARPATAARAYPAAPPAADERWAHTEPPSAGGATAEARVAAGPQN